MWRRKKIRLKKFTEANFSNLVFIFVMYLLNEVYRKIMGEIHFGGYEDLTETGS